METFDVRRRRFVGILAGAVAAGAIGVQPLAAQATAPAHRWPLWSIRRSGRTLYLTAETPPRPADWRDARIEPLLARCSSIWTETNNVYAEPQGTLIERYGMDAARPLDTWLDTHDKARLARAASYCKVNLDELAPYKPWIVGASLQESFYRAAGWTGKSAREVLTASAVQTGKPWHCEFEKKDDVMAWFGAMTPLQDTQFLRYILDEVLAGPAADDRIFRAWAAGDRGPAEDEVARCRRAYPELAERLTLARNRAWLPRFEKMLEAPGSPLVVVGLYHMVGPSGILALAQEHGWTVEAA